MTWSDAARAAALEARRLHALLRRDSSTRSPVAAHAFMYSKDRRTQLAAQLRKLHRGTSAMGLMKVDSVVRSAVSSTGHRNAQRRVDRYIKHDAKLAVRRAAYVAKRR